MVNFIQELLDFLDSEDFHNESFESKILFIPEIFEYFNSKNIKFDNITNEFYKTIVNFIVKDVKNEEIAREWVLNIIDMNCQIFLTRNIGIEEVEEKEETDEFISSYDNPKANKVEGYDMPDKKYDWDFLKSIGVENPE